MTAEASSKPNKSKSALLAAGLFYLAGLMSMLTGLFSRGFISMYVAIGAMFIAIGAMFTEIGTKHKKEEEQQALDGPSGGNGKSQ